MTRQDKIEGALYEFMFKKQGIVKTFNEALNHTSGEPISLYGSDISQIASIIDKTLEEL